MKKLLSILILLLSTSANGMDVEKDSRVLNLNGCTGFIVDGNYLVSAKHCLESLGQKITLSKSKGITAELVYVPNTEDGPIVYHIKGEKRYKSFKLADKVPPSGSLVSSIGYPGGNYAVLTGKMIGTIDRAKIENSVSMRVNPGHSGGPLLSENGEVIGVTLSVPHDLDVNYSNFASWAATTKAVNAARGKTGYKGGLTYQKELVIFSYVGCTPCRNLDAELDYAELARNNIKVTKVILNSQGQWSNKSLVNEFSAANGHRLNSYPTMWLRGSTQYKVGYKKGTKLSVLGWIIHGFKSIKLFLFGSDLSGEIKDEDYTTPPVPVPDSEPLPEAGLELENGPIVDAPSTTPETFIEEVDWENVSIIIAAKKQITSYVRGQALQLALKAVKGPIQRANAEFFEGKANIFLVDERTQPARYNSLLTAAGIDFEKFYVIVLIKKQSLGLKGFIASRVESCILEKLPEGIPIELVFERIHSESYNAITTSLIVTDTAPEPLTANLKEDLIEAVQGQIEGIRSDFYDSMVHMEVPDEASIAEKVKAKVIPALLEAAKPKDEDGTERTWMMRVMAGLMALVGGAQGVTGVRSWLAERAIKKVKAVTGIS